MERMIDRTRLAPGRAAGWALLAMVAIGTFWCALTVLSRRGGPAPEDLATGPVAALPGDGPAASAPTTGSRPATGTATATATPWRPPRHTARQTERDDMVRVIRLHWRRDGTTEGIEPVAAAMAAVPRHEFVPADVAAAYDDRALPIGYGQTISQPYIVAEMTRLLKLTPTSRVLEIGTGSGYQAAVLTHFTPHVYTIEIVKPLADAAGRRLRRLGYRVVDARAGDGWHGWAAKAPFDAIIVTCAARQIPPPLIKQLKPGGRMVIPVGRPHMTQSLVLLTKDADGKVRTRSLMWVGFVPLVRPSESK